MILDTDSSEVETHTTSMGTGKKAAEPRSRPLRHKAFESNRGSTAISTTKAKARTASSQAIRSSRTAKRRRVPSQSSGNESADAFDEYTPSSRTSPSVASAEESEALANTSEGEDGNTNHDVANIEEDSESDERAIPAAKRRKIVSQDKSQRVESSQKMVIGPWNFKPGIDMSLPPMHDIGEIFDDITKKAVNMSSFTYLLNRLSGRELNVATMCSGTESPLLALGLIADGQF